MQASAGLKVYAGVMTVLTGALVLTGLTQGPTVEPVRFTEIEVERINVVEPDGTLKLVVSNSARQAEATIGGEELPVDRTRDAGLIFFNDYGDEVGGLVFGGDRERGGMGLMFDQAGHDQVIGIQSGEWTVDGERRRRTGINLWDRPFDVTILDLIRMQQEAQAIEDEEERRLALAELQEAGLGGVSRASFGRSEAGDVGLELRDGQGHVRLRLLVMEDGTTLIQFLDEAGAVVHALGPDAAGGS